RRSVPRFLPRLLRHRRRHRCRPRSSPPVARRSRPHRPRHRPRPPRRHRTRTAMSPLPRHLLPDTAEIGPDGALSIGGCDVTELAEQYGTPLFIYDEQHLRTRCREAVTAFPDGVAYAG